MRKQRKEVKMDEERDDDYREDLYLERKKREGWMLCDGCGDWLHVEDTHNGCNCCCAEEEE